MLLDFPETVLKMSWARSSDRGAHGRLMYESLRGREDHIGAYVGERIDEHNVLANRDGMADDQMSVGPASQQVEALSDAVTGHLSGQRGSSSLL